jgi:hypothetical protein
MPMIDVYAAAGTFPDSHALAQDLAAAVMRWEQVPDLPLFANNTAAFIHNIDEAAISNVAGESNYVRVQVLTPVGVLDRDKQLGVVEELTEIVAAAARDPSLRERTSAPGKCRTDATASTRSVGARTQLPAHRHRPGLQQRGERRAGTARKRGPARSGVHHYQGQSRRERPGRRG